MGTHVNGPCKISGTSIPLQEHIGSPLPFLFKVLSVRKALSIQAHPDEHLAKVLRAKDPANYPDDQPKPEMAVALSDFDVLCGFRPITEIFWFFENLPPLRQMLCQPDFTQAPSSIIKFIVNAIFTVSNDKISLLLKEINEFLLREKDLRPWKRIFYKIFSEYSNDAGVLFLFVMNHFSLQPGMAIFLAANQPHAYLYGGERGLSFSDYILSCLDCVEIMTASDNVVRAGLTPKFKDVNTLISMLDFVPKSLEEFQVCPQRISESVEVYQPPIDGFSLLKITIKEKETVSLPAIQTHSILICISGKSTLSFDVHTRSLSKLCVPGKVFFIAATYASSIENATSENCCFYRAIGPSKERSVYT